VPGLSGNPALCLSLSQPSEVQPGTLTCAAGGEDTTYFPIGGGRVGDRNGKGGNDKEGISRKTTD
jgi:hypothetical protein